MKPYRQAVMAVILKSDKTFLIGSSPRDGGYKFPQGGLDLNEAPKEGLIRELKEELGIEIDDGDILFKLENTVKYNYPEYKPYSKIYSGQEMHVFVISFQNRFTPVAQDDEFEQFHWITQNQMNQFDFTYRQIAYMQAIEQILELIA